MSADPNLACLNRVAKVRYPISQQVRIQMKLRFIYKQKASLKLEPLNLSNNEGYLPLAAAQIGEPQFKTGTVKNQCLLLGINTDKLQMRQYPLQGFLVRSKPIHKLRPGSAVFCGATFSLKVFG